MEREIAAVGARLQETYDRVRRALDARVQQAGRRNTRRSSSGSAEQVARLEAQVQHLANQQSADLQGYIKWSKTLGKQVARLGKQVQHLAEQHASDQQGYVKWSERTWTNSKAS